VVLAASLALLATDGALVVAGTFQKWDRKLAYQGWQLVGSNGVRLVEAPSLIGVSVHSSRDFSILSACAVLLVAAAIAWKGYRWSAVTIVLSVTGASIAATMLKLAVVRSGPPLTPWTPVGHSFPSGTAAGAAALFGALAYLALQSPMPRRIARLVATISTILVIVYIASSLTYHYPSEVMGGLAVGAGWLSVVLIVLWPPLRHELFARRSIGRRGRWPSTRTVNLP
jgi:membrane-associated phospholipid phosphatase